ncbi:MAG TPA: hypothetical protein VFA81_09980 [Burkholderiales bacterium]|nr:hypothetical protein [Burkholderiales bacterium]
MTAVALRLIGFLALLTIGGAVFVAFATKDRRWLRFAWQLFKYTVFVAALFLAFWALERLILVI